MPPAPFHRPDPAHQRQGSGSPVTFNGANAKTRCTGPGPVNTGGETLFEFYRLRPDATTAPTQITPPTGGYSTPTDESTLKFVASVHLTLQVRAEDLPEVSPTVVEQWITLVNQSNAIRIGKIS